MNGDDVAPTKSFFGKNGVYRPDKHRSVSGCYLLERDVAVFAPNPFATHPIVNFVRGAETIEIVAGQNVKID